MAINVPVIVPGEMFEADTVPGAILSLVTAPGVIFDSFILLAIC